MEAVDKLYWTKALIAALLGVLFSFLQLATDLSGYAILSVGLALQFLISDLLGRIFNVEKTRSWKIGIGAYFFTWLIVWIVFFTLLRGKP